MSLAVKKYFFMSIKRRGSPKSHRKLGNLVQRDCAQPPAVEAHITATRTIQFVTY